MRNAECCCKMIACKGQALRLFWLLKKFFVEHTEAFGNIGVYGSVTGNVGPLKEGIP